MAPGGMVKPWRIVGLGAGAAAEHPDGGVEAHGFGEDHVGEAEVGIVGGSGLAVAEDANGFVVALLLDFGVFGKQPEGEGEGVGGGLVAGEQDGEALVADLLVGHAAVCFV